MIEERAENSDWGFHCDQCGEWFDDGDELEDNVCADCRVAECEECGEYPDHDGVVCVACHVKRVFSGIEFNPTWHSYTLDGKSLTSVTKAVSRLKPDTDWDAIASKVAAREDKTSAEVKAEWAAKRDYGTLVHKQIADILRGQQPPADPFLDINPVLPEVLAFEDFWEKSQSQEAAQYQVEWVVGDAGLALAGTVDAVLYSIRAGLYHVFDWKTGGSFATGNDWGRWLKKPFDDLPDCELSIYSLQVSLYRLIIERNAGIPMGNSYIVHLTSDGLYRVYQAVDYRARLLEWIEAGK